MKKIVIIGANSYLARNLIFTLSSNKEVTLLLYDRDCKHFDHYNNYIQINLASKIDIITNVDFNCDSIYYFSGKTGTKQGFTDYDEYIDVNEKYFLNFLFAYVDKKSKAKIIYPSSRLVYANSKNNVSENALKDFKSIYAVTKFVCESYLKMYSEIFGIKYCILRIGVPFGTLLNDVTSYGIFGFFVKKASNNENIIVFGDGSQKRTFTHIKDICYVFEQAAINNKLMNDIYNIGGVKKTVIDIAELIAKQYSVGIDFVEWPKLDKIIEVPSVVFNSSKLDDILHMHYIDIDTYK